MQQTSYRFGTRTFILALALFCSASLLFADEPAKPFAIHVIDADTQRGIPLVILETPDRRQYVTDSAGYIAIDEPGLSGLDVHFKIVTTHGYEYPLDGFGIRGKRLTISPGQIENLELKRTSIAQRLYRITGSGIYQHTLKLGFPAPIDRPLLNAQVAGSDSVLSAIYHDQIYWFWGDTNRMSYPLGNLHTTSARSPLPAKDVLPISQGINLDYFVRDDGFVKSVAKMPGEGPTWLSSVTVFRDDNNVESMYATYFKIRDGLHAFEWGLAKWNDIKNEFEQVKSFGAVPDGSRHQQGHTFRHTDPDGQSYIYLANPFALNRVRDDVAAFIDPNNWEHYTPLIKGNGTDDFTFEQDPNGKLIYAWNVNAPSLTQEGENKLIEAKVLSPDEAHMQLRDAKTGRSVMAHSGSTYWNDYRHKWIMIFVEIGGTNSNLGDVWYAEADAPQGPWQLARQIATHERYDFYNPKHHPYFDEEGGRVIYFEGSYTNTFSGNPIATPQYEYNQLMYRLDLADPHLGLQSTP